MKMYISYNGSSSIDLVFSNMNSNTSQKALRNIVRKYLPIETTFIIKKYTVDTPTKYNIQEDRPHEAQRRGENYVIIAIKGGKLEEAVTTIEQIIKGTITEVPKIHRKSKPWFNKSCYTARRSALEALHFALNTKIEDSLRKYAIFRKTIKK